MKILIAEDDPNTRSGLIDLLESEGYQVVEAATGKEALSLYVKEKPDVLCLDIMMPDVNGYDVCREIRRDNLAVPILFISAKSEEIDKVLGLELGADDFIVKPFGVKEVLARIRAVIRRSKIASKPPAESAEFRMGDLRIIPEELKAYRGKKPIKLTLRDVKILQLLHSRKGKVIDRDCLFDVCWGMDYMPNSRSLDQYISQLRKKIEKDPKHPRILLTVHNAGYRYEG